MLPLTTRASQHLHTNEQWQSRKRARAGRDRQDGQERSRTQREDRLRPQFELNVGCLVSKPQSDLNHCSQNKLNCAFHPHYIWLNTISSKSRYIYMSVLPHLPPLLPTFYQVLLQPFINLRVMRHTAARGRCIPQQSSSSWSNHHGVRRMDSPITRQRRCCSYHRFYSYMPLPVRRFYILFMHFYIHNMCDVFRIHLKRGSAGQISSQCSQLSGVTSNPSQKTTNACCRRANAP